MSTTCEVCGGPRVSGKGDSKHCPKCYARMRRGTTPDHERGRRTAALQVKVTPEFLAAIDAASGGRRSDWCREFLAAAIAVWSHNTITSPDKIHCAACACLVKAAGHRCVAHLPYRSDGDALLIAEMANTISELTDAINRLRVRGDK